MSKIYYSRPSAEVFCTFISVGIKGKVLLTRPKGLFFASEIHKLLSGLSGPKSSTILKPFFCRTIVHITRIVRLEKKVNLLDENQQHFRVSHYCFVFLL